MKTFEQQYSRHKSKRPQAEAAIDQSNSLFTVAFSWGEISPSQKINDALLNYFFAAQNDIEITSPFEVLPSLTVLANKVRTSLLIANGAVYSNFNTKAFVAGCEFLSIAVDNQEVVIGQVGGPSCILIRKGKNILLSANTDHYFTKTDPLPVSLVGPYPECYPQLVSFRFEEGDQLLLLACSYLPSHVLTLDLTSSLQNLTKLISQENPTVPFWLGRLNL